MTSLKNKLKNEKTKRWIILGVIVFLVLVAILTPIVFPNTQFEVIIASTIGRFFNLFHFFQTSYMMLLESFAILIFVWIISQLLALIIKVLTRKNNRSITISHMLVNISKALATFIAGILILNTWGVQMPTILAGLGIIGLALSFGAQSLIEDILSGLILISENQFCVGDIIQIAGFRGTVISIGLRTTRIEDINGDIQIINNSDIRNVINTSANLSPVYCDISIGYGEDLKKVEKIIMDNLPKIKQQIPAIQEGPWYKGVQSLADSSVVIRVFARADECHRIQSNRDLNRAMKLLFDEYKIEIPFPQIVVTQAKQPKE